MSRHCGAVSPHGDRDLLPPFLIALTQKVIKIPDPFIHFNPLFAFLMTDYLIHYKVM